MIYRLYVEKTEGNNVTAKKALSDIRTTLGIKITDVRVFLRYDVEDITESDMKSARSTVFSEPPVDNVTDEVLPELNGYDVFGVEFLPGQYDQRADSASQCVQMLTLKARPTIRCATIYAIKGAENVIGSDSIATLDRIKKYIINPVEARLASLDKPVSLKMVVEPPAPLEIIDGFISWTDEEIAVYHKKMGFAMAIQDLMFVRDYFASEPTRNMTVIDRDTDSPKLHATFTERNPTITELKVIDTYWSDHCRHTTFSTELVNVEFDTEIPQIKQTYDIYKDLFAKHHAGKSNKVPCLMDIAIMGVRELKAQGKLDNLDESDEINACSIVVPVDIDGKTEEWLVMFKNETHNHPTEIEPYGGAATCLGGAIRDPLSGRVYVYQAMRVTGCGNPNVPICDTLEGKLPQRVISKTAASGFSSYGNQIGLATGMVSEIYHEGYIAKRLETGFVVGAAPRGNVVRNAPTKGDVVILIGGETGRDGCGGATGSSKVHTFESIDKCSAEVQKGNPLTERKIQRLFRNEKVTHLIKKCNDFGAGGVCVAIGELADSLDIFLDQIPKKYLGLGETELAISESQERMAVVVEMASVTKMLEYCADENLQATIVAKITHNGHMRMFYNGNAVVDLKRSFLDTNGVRQEANVLITDKKTNFFHTLDTDIANLVSENKLDEAAIEVLSSLNVASQKGLGEIFDGTIGAGSVLMPFGGKSQLTPAISMSALIPVTNGFTDTATVVAYGFDADLMTQSPYIGAVYSILTSVIKVVISGAPFSSIRLTLQEFFPRLFSDPERWGLPTSALLGALAAQLNLGLGAIGGKDSMSGTFEKIDVPPTLISFALGVTKASKVISNALTTAGKTVYKISLPRDSYSLPIWDKTIKILETIYADIDSGNITYASIVDKGGYIAAIIKSCLGSCGFNFEVTEGGFLPLLGDIVFSANSVAELSSICSVTKIGSTTDKSEYRLGNDVASSVLSSDDAVKAFTGTFGKLYPTTAEASGEVTNLSYQAKNIIFTKNKVAKPKVFIPVFPGTNCEYDTAKRFQCSGAEPEIFVVKNQTPSQIDQSVSEMARLIKSCQIIAFPGGFSGGDEPDGSGKFIATTFRNAAIKDSVLELLYKRDGLALGICNGFQALIKLGLLPYGTIEDMTTSSPTLTFNNLPRHISTISTLRVASNLSPWLSAVKVGDVFGVAISHGEGKFVAPQAEIDKLIACGQVATQYTDESGNASMVSPFNPNGSIYAIEGITSADGRILGKMGHSERIGNNLYKNVEHNYDMKIFESGVKYFK